MLNAIVPIFLLIMLGLAIRRMEWLSDDFWNDVEKLVYYILFPALLISKMSVADLQGADVIPLLSFLWLCLGAMAVLTFLIRPLVNVDGPSFTSVFQGATRINTYICLSLAESFFVNSGLVTAVLIAAILIPVLNFLVVIVLQQFGDSKVTNSLLHTAKNILKNPLIIGCVIGMGLNLSNIHLPDVIQLTISILGSTALPLGLLAVGAALIFKDISTVIRPLVATSILKLIVYPILAYLLMPFFHFDRETEIIILIFSAVPTASSAYILAKNMGGDHQLMSRIITVQTLLSGFTFLLMFWLLGI